MGGRSMIALLTMLALIAQQATDPGAAVPTIDGLLTWVNIGLAGVGLIAFVRGWIVPGKRFDELDARLTRSETAHDEERARWYVERSEFTEQLDRFSDSLDRIAVTLDRIEQRQS